MSAGGGRAAHANHLSGKFRPNSQAHMYIDVDVHFQVPVFKALPVALIVKVMLL